jgi:hypothetical protein
VRGQYDVAEALLYGDEPVPVGAHHAAVFQRYTVEHLQRIAGRVVEDHHFAHPAIGKLFGRAFLVRDTVRVETLPYLVEFSR